MKRLFIALFYFFLLTNISYAQPMTDTPGLLIKSEGDNCDALLLSTGDYFLLDDGGRFLLSASGDCSEEDFTRFRRLIFTGSVINNDDGSATISSGTGTQLDELNDVGSATATAGNILVADGTDFQSVAMSGGATIASDGEITFAISLTGLSDVGSATTTEGNILVADGADWESVEMTGDCTILAGGEVECGASGVDIGVEGYFAYYSTTGTALTDQGVLFTDGTNIGIGTSEPEYLLDVNGIARFGGSGGVTLETGGAVRTATTSGNTALLQGYNTGTTSYTTFGTLTAGSTPTFDLSASTTIGGIEIVNRTGAQTLTNKTLTSPIIASISNSGTVTLPTGADTLVGRATTDTLTNKTLTSPKIGTSILDTNAANYLTLTPATTAVNYLNYTNAATGSDPVFTVIGDANRGIGLTMAGTGGVLITSTNTGPSTIKRGLTVNNDSNSGAGDNFTVKGSTNATALAVNASSNFVGIGTSAPVSELQVIGVIVPKKATSDPCSAGIEGGIFYNDTSNYWCGCNGTDDVKLTDNTTACF